MSRKVASDEPPAYSFDFAPDLDADDPATRWVRVTGGDLPCEIELRLGRPQRGRMVCTGLRVGAPDGGEEYPVTARMLRDVRLGEVLRTIRESASGAWEDFLSVPTPGLDPETRARLLAQGFEDVVRLMDELEGVTGAEAIVRKAKPLPSVRRGRRGLDPEVLRRTAEVYLEVLAGGSRRPQEETARLLHVDVSTVCRRLQAAWRRFPEMKPKHKPRRRR